nr:MAG TPA: Meiotic recombination protein [Caudoviricetes sp.]
MVQGFTHYLQLNMLLLHISIQRGKSLPLP